MGVGLFANISFDLHTPLTLIYETDPYLSLTFSLTKIGLLSSCITPTKS